MKYLMFALTLFLSACPEHAPEDAETEIDAAGPDAWTPEVDAATKDCDAGEEDAAPDPGQKWICLCIEDGQQESVCAIDINDAISRLPAACTASWTCHEAGPCL